MMGYSFFKYCIIIIVLSCYFGSFAQSSFGIMGGWGKSRFVNVFKDDSYHAKYKVGDGYCFSGFYETKTDSFGKLKFELTYAQQDLSLDVFNIITHAASYTRYINYKNQFVKFNTISTIKIINKPFLRTNFLVGFSIKYNVQTAANGYGSDPYQYLMTDTSGNTYYVPSSRSWIVNDNSSPDFRPINLGLETGIELGIPLSKKLDLIFQNRYNMDIFRVLRMKGINHTLIIATSLNLGLRYNLN